MEKYAVKIRAFKGTNGKDGYGGIFVIKNILYK